MPELTPELWDRIHTLWVLSLKLAEDRSCPSSRVAWCLRRIRRTCPELERVPDNELKAMVNKAKEKRHD